MRPAMPTTAEDLGVGTTAPVPVTDATWLVRASTTQPFSMACSSEGTLDYKVEMPRIEQTTMAKRATRSNQLRTRAVDLQGVAAFGPGVTVDDDVVRPAWHVHPADRFDSLQVDRRR